MAQIKQKHANDVQSIQVEIISLKEEVHQLKRKRYAHIVVSSPSSPHDVSQGVSATLGNSPKQGEENRG